VKDLSIFDFLKAIFFVVLRSLFLLAFIMLSFTFLGGLMINYKTEAQVHHHHHHHVLILLLQVDDG
jgi:hypothetical protein